MLHLISVRQKLVYKTTLALQWLFISIISFHNGFCQNQNTTNTLQNYPYDIVKLSIYREDLNEVNISDAVILDPVSRAIEIKTDTISLDLHNGSSLHITVDQPTNNGIGFTCALGSSCTILGGGSRAIPTNRKGYKLSLDNNPWYGYGDGADNLNFSVPFFINSEGYGIFVDNPSKGFTDIGKTKSYEWLWWFEYGPLDVYIIPGEDIVTILQKYHQLTGTQPLPPKWAMGNFMSRFGYESSAQIEDISQKMINDSIPFDAVIIDLFWFGDSIKGGLGNLEWVNTEKWPNPKKMIADLKNKNIQTILITEPFFLKNTKNFSAALPYLSKDTQGNPYMLKDFYFGDGGLIDIFNTEAQKWFWPLYHAQMKLGVEGWWSDLGEPEKHPIDMWHNVSIHDSTYMLPSHKVHNIYGHYWNKMLFENFKTYFPSKRFFSLARSGYSGSQRYGIVPWSGDVSRSWSGLKAQIKIMTGMSMSGIPYMHSDAGGFAGGEGEDELYIRWLNMSIFSPILRPHGTALYDKDKQAFSYPSEQALFDNPTKSIVRNLTKLRYKMLPYNYNLTYEHYKYGLPLTSPMIFYYPNEKNISNYDDQYMWGKDLLIAPILDKDLNSKKVILPHSKWYRLYFQDDKIFSEEFSQGEYTVYAPIYSIPVFIKSGAFLPLSYQIAMNTKTIDYTQLTIHYFYDEGDSQRQYFEDDGENVESVINEHYLIHNLRKIEDQSNIKMYHDIEGKGYKTAPQNRKITYILHNCPPSKRVTINGLSTINESKTIGSYKFTLDL